MIFKYAEDQLSHIITLNNKPNHVDHFTESLLTAWKSLECLDVFNYKLNVEKEKVLDGKHGFLLQLNRERSLKRRPPQQMSSVVQPFDESKFNFNKISEKEVLFEIEFDGVTEDTLIINSSPLTQCHSLLCHNRKSCLPQRLTCNSLISVIRLMWFSQNRDIRVGYNSPGALASVNHLHFHLLYLPQTLPIDLAKCYPKPIMSNLYEIDNEYPAKGFCLQIVNKTEIINISKTIIKIIDIAIELNIPHNMFIIIGDCLNSVDSAQKSLKIFIFPRKDSFDLKQLGTFNLAFCELSGYVPVGAEEDFNSLTENQLTEIMHDGTVAAFHTMKTSIRSVIKT